MTNYIGREAQIIAKILAARKIGARLQLRPDRRVSYLMTPSTVSYRVELKASTPVSQVYKMQPDFLSHITRFRAEKGVPDYDRTSVRVDMIEQIIEVSRVDPEMVSYRSVEWNHTPNTALCGIAYHHGRSFPLTWRLDDPDQAHVLVAGTTGSGKTNELMSIMLSLALHNSPENLRFSVIDMKRSRDLRVFDQIPHMLSVAREPDEALQLLRNYYAEMDQRERGAVPTSWRHVLVIDEAASLLAATDKAIRTESMMLLEEIGRKGRENGLNLILCTQTPKAKLLGDQLRNVLMVRLVGAVATDVESDVAVGVARAGAEMLPGRGAMLYRHTRTLKRFQAPLVETPAGEVRRILRAHAGVYVVQGGANAPVRTGASEKRSPVTRVENEKVFAPVQVVQPVQPVQMFPLTVKRPLLPSEAAEVRRLSSTMSKNALCYLVYGAKSTRYMEWINDALSTGPVSVEKPAPFSFRTPVSDLKPM